MSATPVLSIRRVALGVEVRDALTTRPLAYPVRVELESGIPHTSGLKSRARFGYDQLADRRPGGLTRHPSGRYSLHYFDGTGDEVDLRIYDFERRYVPRRLRIPIVDLDVVLNREDNEVADYMAERVRLPVLYPGAAYPLSRVTGLRGRVMRGSVPERWAVIEARSLTNGGTVQARARADNRGEFLLIIPPQAFPASDLTSTFDLTVAAFSRPAVPTPASVDVPSQDPYWDAPLELIVDPSPSDPVSAGTRVPAGFVETTSVTNVTFQLDRLLTSRDVGDLIFTPP